MSVSRVHKSGKVVSSSHSAWRHTSRRLLLVVAVSIQMASAFQVFSRNFAIDRSIMKRKHEAIVDKASCRLFGAAADSAKTESPKQDTPPQEPVSLYRSEGIFAVKKPLDWTSNDVVSYIRGMLERDARGRGAKPVNVTSRRNKSRILKVGHGGTLDPLASGVLVIGVGKGTKELQR